MSRAERSDKGLPRGQRAAYVRVPCTGCGVEIKRRRSEMRERMFHSRDCYKAYMERAFERLRQYELLYGPLPGEQPSVTGLDLEIP